MRLAPLGIALLLATTLVACGGSAATIAPTTAPTDAPTLAPTPTPEPTVAPTETPTPAPSIDGEGGGELAEAVVSALQSDPLITQVDQTGSVTAGGSTFDVVGVYLIDGEDMSLHIEISGAGVSQASDIIVVGDTAYARTGTDPFEEAPRTVVAASLAAALVAVRLVDDPSLLRHVGTETIDGRELQHLTAAGTIPYAPASGGEGRYDVFDMYVEDDGTPVLVRTAYSATDAAGNEATGETDFAYSSFGGPIEIAIPD